MESRRNNDLPVRKTALPSNANDKRDTRIAATVPQALAYMGVKERNTAEKEVRNYIDMFVANVIKEHEYENSNAKLLNAQMSGENRPAFAKMPMVTVQLKGIEEGSILHQKAQEAYEKEAKKCAQAFAAAQIGGMIAANAVLIEQLHEANFDFVRNVAKMATALGKDTCVVDPGTHELDDMTMGGVKMSSDAFKNLFVDVAKNGTPNAEMEPRSAQHACSMFIMCSKSREKSHVGRAAHFSSNSSIPSVPPSLIALSRGPHSSQKGWMTRAHSREQLSVAAG